MFRLGRTDTIRSASSASAAFVKAFDNPAKQNTEKVELLEKAVKAHRWYTNMVGVIQSTTNSSSDVKGTLHELSFVSIRPSMDRLLTDTFSALRCWLLKNKSHCPKSSLTSLTTKLCITYSLQVRCIHLHFVMSFSVCINYLHNNKERLTKDVLIIKL